MVTLNMHLYMLLYTCVHRYVLIIVVSNVVIFSALFSSNQPRHTSNLCTPQLKSERKLRSSDYLIKISQLETDKERLQNEVEKLQNKVEDLKIQLEKKDKEQLQIEVEDLKTHNESLCNKVKKLELLLKR